VTTKAGTFDIFLVVSQSDAIGRSFKQTIRHWYAPEPGVTVKIETIANLNTIAGEAVAIKHK
jgi:hypothetical protein